MQPPTPKMPVTRAIFMLGVALFFSIIILIFASLPFTLPFIVGAGAGAIASHYVGTTLGTWFGSFVAGSTGALELLTGVGAVAIGVAGEVAAGAIESFAFLLFIFWFRLAGIDANGQFATKRLFASIGFFFAGMIPILNILPTLLINIILQIMWVRKEDAAALRAFQQNQVPARPTKNSGRRLAKNIKTAERVAAAVAV